ncbi:hypothetical protein PS900_00872 [Pseudomonas fluorescens]|uniref:Uncharacterized protein n=1 Tax=Pseudomonas fluorescens TaxID=294 RepID=A0A8H2RPN7_PSEFL|nr:hypothetical protein [Pseudomonas fluorescens]VVO62503.1 hypothetical protein PS900_00872 [Pseudomonas fluorescens]
MIEGRTHASEHIITRTARELEQLGGQGRAGPHRAVGELDPLQLVEVTRPGTLDQLNHPI